MSVTTSVQSASEAGWRMYPSQLYAGQELTIELPESWLNQQAEIRVFDAAGRNMLQQNIEFQARSQQLQLPSQNWMAGIYYLVIHGEQGIVRQTLSLH